MTPILRRKSAISWLSTYSATVSIPYPLASSTIARTVLWERRSVTTSRTKRVKGVSYTLTKLGVRVTDEYAKLKRELVIRQTEDIAELQSKVEMITRTLTMLTGLYEECARVAATYSPPP